MKISKSNITFPFQQWIHTVVVSHKKINSDSSLNIEIMYAIYKENAMNLGRKQLVQRSIGRCFENTSCFHTPNKDVCKLCVTHTKMTENEAAVDE
jgi:hypothetical protein